LPDPAQNLEQLLGPRLSCALPELLPGHVQADSSMSCTLAHVALDKAVYACTDAFYSNLSSKHECCLLVLVAAPSFVHALAVL